jgi:hypothetical protein
MESARTLASGRYMRRSAATSLRMGRMLEVGARTIKKSAAGSAATDRRATSHADPASSAGINSNAGIGTSAIDRAIGQSL